MLLLQHLGANVTGYALPPPTSPSLFDLADVGQEITSINGDIRDLGSVREAVHVAQPQVVIHLAAQALVRASYEDPVESFTTNVLGTVHLLEACRHEPACRVLINVTTDKCYKNREWVWGYREEDALGGDDPYSASKSCAELATAAYRTSFFTTGAHDGGVRSGLATARAGNVIGGGDWGRDRLIPDLLRAADSGRLAQIRYPDAVRPWQHVLDPLSGYLLLAERLWEERDAYEGAWNFGPLREEARDVRWIVARFQELWPQEFQWAEEGGCPPKEAGLLMLDSSKSRTTLGWRPRLEIDEAFEWTVAWYQAVRVDPHSAHRICLEQIADYQRRAPML
jgi:CDP-glucose 4,6-dehydratase